MNSSNPDLPQHDVGQPADVILTSTDAREAYNAAIAQRKGDWMQTWSGRQFWPLDPRVEDIDLRDIAHSLSMQCRYAGHCRTFYSVAEHSVLMARWMLDRDGFAGFAPWALLHDAPEAYLVDVPRPVKPFLVGYNEIEDRLMSVIAEAFGLRYAGPGALPAIVKQVDNSILADEYPQLMVQSVPWNLPYEPLGVTITGWSPWKAKLEFLATARVLGLKK